MEHTAWLWEKSPRARDAEERRAWVWMVRNQRERLAAGHEELRDYARQAEWFAERIRRGTTKNGRPYSAATLGKYRRELRNLETVYEVTLDAMHTVPTYCEWRRVAPRYFDWMVHENRARTHPQNGDVTHESLAAVATVPVTPPAPELSPVSRPGDGGSVDAPERRPAELRRSVERLAQGEARTEPVRRTDAGAPLREIVRRMPSREELGPLVAAIEDHASELIGLIARVRAGARFAGTSDDQVVELAHDLIVTHGRRHGVAVLEALTEMGRAFGIESADANAEAWLRRRLTELDENE